MYIDNCFITLTYDDEHLPHDHSLVKSDFQDFMKRFRNEFRIRKINPATGRLKTYYTKKLRYYQAGEYGKATPENDFIARPHYHAIIFNHQFDDRKIFLSREGIDLCTSDSLDSIWNNGFASVGELTFESAAYVARYIMKKVNGDAADDHYTRTDYTTGEVLHILPEYATMSRGGKEGHGIGYDWFQRYKTDCYPSDTISVRGVNQKPPRYYDTIYALDPCNDLELIKHARKQQMRKHLKDNTPDRLAVRKEVFLAKINQLPRTIS